MTAAALMRIGIWRYLGGVGWSCRRRSRVGIAPNEAMVWLYWDDFVQLCSREHEWRTRSSCLLERNCTTRRVAPAAMTEFFIALLFWVKLTRATTARTLMLSSRSCSSLMSRGTTMFSETSSVTARAVPFSSPSSAIDISTSFLQTAYLSWAELCCATPGLSPRCSSRSRNREYSVALAPWHRLCLM